jgi:hypothetical protein
MSRTDNKMTENLQPERAKSVTFNTTVLIQGDAESTGTFRHTIMFDTKEESDKTKCAFFSTQQAIYCLFNYCRYIYVYIYI